MKTEIVNNLCRTSKLPIIKNKLSLDNGTSYSKLSMYRVKKHPCFTICLQCVMSKKKLLSLVMLMQTSVKLTLGTEILIPNYQPLFFKLTQPA